MVLCVYASRPVDVMIYAVTDDTTESSANVDQTKTFLNADQLMAFFAADASGTPSSAITGKASSQTETRRKTDE